MSDVATLFPIGERSPRGRTLLDLPANSLAIDGQEVRRRLGLALDCAQLQYRRSDGFEALTMLATPRAKKRLKVLTPRPVQRRDVTKFIDHCIILRAIWLHYQELFEASALRRELLETVAPTFFGDLNLLLIEHLILQICKLTDEEGTEKRRNLTTHFLANNADLSKTPDGKKRLAQLVRQIAQFRKRILPARNKAIGHLDLRAAHRRTSLGGAPVPAWHQFWLDLQEFVAILHKRYVDPKGSFHLNGVGRVSDADQLAQALRESTYFRAAIADASITHHVWEIAFAAEFYSA